MKLLKKSTVQNDVAEQRKNQVDEGLALAKKIDALRQTLLQEETNLALFRAGTIGSVNQEIETISRKKEILEDEVRDLDERRRIATLPLDKEWKDLESHSKELDLKEQNYKDKYSDLMEGYAYLTRETKALDSEKKRLDKQSRDLDVLNQKSLETKSSAEKIYQEAENTKNDINIHSSQVSKELLHKRTNLLALERELEIKNQKLNSKEQELLQKERAINDKYETLLRTQKYVTERKTRRK